MITNALLTFTTLSLASASIIPRQYVEPDIPERGKQSCVRQWYGLGNNDDWENDFKLCFTTFVGVSYDSGRGCAGILNNLNADYSLPMLDWKCEGVWHPPLLPKTWDGDLEFTRLHFCAVVHEAEFHAGGATQTVGGIIDRTLERVYAGVIDDFNCGA